MRIKSLYTLIGDFFLSLLFEKHFLVRKLEKMNAQEFRSTVKRSLIPSALFCYKDPLVKSLIWNMKYRKNRKCFRLAAELLHEKTKTLGKETYILIPAPLSSQRRKERGYNQAEELAKELKRFDSTAILTIRTDIIRKKLHTSRQTELSKEERRRNLIGAFEIIDTESVKGKNIIILDDVITTGATIGELAKLLKAAGVKKIIPLAFAH